jgi:hydroxymethylpyrimidine/phosphomethylpyrimidine kinase
MDKNVLTIAGLDPSGCAGISADLRAFAAFGAHGMSVVTAITAQNTQRVESVFPVAAEIIRAQLNAIVSDISVDAVKIGLLPDLVTLQTVVSLCKEFELTNIVVDPVLRSTTGFDFAGTEIVDAYRQLVFPIADVITPNLDETSAFTGLTELRSAAKILRNQGAKNVIITGGHLPHTAMDLFYDGTQFQEFDAPKIVSDNTRGLGCTFSSIIAVHLARSQSIRDAIKAAKKYIELALTPSWKLGKGKGPLNFRSQM